MRKLLSLMLIASVAFAAPATYAAQCRDAQGKFTKCQPKPVHCRDSTGKYVKCSAPGASPA
jgi:hypothetical protein